MPRERLLLAVSIYTATAAFPTLLDCETPMEIGEYIMNGDAIFDDARTVFFERDSVALECGSTYTPGETLVAKLDTTADGVQHVMQVSGGLFSEQAAECTGPYTCDGTRCAQGDFATGSASVIAPINGDDLILKSAFAYGFGVVSITAECPLFPMLSEPTAKPTLLPSLAPVTPTLTPSTTATPSFAPINQTVDSRIVARFSLAGGAAIDEISGAACATPASTPKKPVESTPENAPMPHPKWNGELDGATYFDGDDWFLCPSSITSTISGDSERTICAWAKVDAINDGALFQYGERQACQHFGLRTSTDAPDFAEALRIQSWDACDVDTAFDQAWIGEWAHYCLTFGGNVSSLFVNWKLEASADTPVDTAGGALSDFFVGYNDIRSKIQLSSFFVGAMSDLVISDKILSVEDMTELSGFDAAVL